jgi:hypothetical protein
MKLTPCVGDLIEVSKSYGKGSNNWFFIDESGNERSINPGTPGIIVEKSSSKYEETSDHFDYKVLIDGVLYEDVSNNMFAVKVVVPL